MIVASYKGNSALEDHYMPYLSIVPFLLLLTSCGSGPVSPVANENPSSQGTGDERAALDNWQDYNGGALNSTR